MSININWSNKRKKNTSFSSEFFMKFGRAPFCYLKGQLVAEKIVCTCLLTVSMSAILLATWTLLQSWRDGFCSQNMTFSVENSTLIAKNKIQCGGKGGSMWMRKFS